MEIIVFWWFLYGDVQIFQTVAQDVEQIDSAFSFAIFKNEQSQENIFSQ